MCVMYVRLCMCSFVKFFVLFYLFGVFFVCVANRCVVAQLGQHELMYEKRGQLVICR